MSEKKLCGVNKMENIYESIENKCVNEKNAILQKLIKIKSDFIIFHSR